MLELRHVHLDILFIRVSCITSFLLLVPFGVVRNMSTLNITPNTLNVTWLPVSPMERRGEVIHYNITVENILHSWQNIENSMREMFIRNISNIFIEKLDNYTIYTVYITAYTTIGAGPTTTVVFRTGQNGKYALISCNSSLRDVNIWHCYKYFRLWKIKHTPKGVLNSVYQIF